MFSELWKETRALDEAGVQAKDYPSIREGIEDVPLGDGQAVFMPEMTDDETEQFLLEQQGWGGFYRKIKRKLGIKTGE